MSEKRPFPWRAVLPTAVVCLALGAYGGSRWRKSPKQVVDAFHIWYQDHNESTYNNTRWLGVETQQCPLDMFIYQELFYEVKPDVLVEAGTYLGGSSYYFASIFDLLGKGRVLTIDIEDHPGKPKHSRVEFFLGSSTAEPTVARIKEAIRPDEKVMVILDSAHHMPHVLNELRLYSPIVSPGSYLIVQDTHFNGHPILPKFGPGPMEAVEEFLRTNRDFEVDRSREKFGMTFNPGGYLKRVR
jgi:cephalosporin hydroxylase